MPIKDKVMLMNKVEETLKPRMFANLLEEAVTDIQGHLDGFDIYSIASDSVCETDDLLDAFISAKRIGGLSEKTLTVYQYAISRFMKYCNVRTRDITKQHVLDYLDSEAKRGLCDTSIEGIRQKLSSYFGWLDREKLILSNPMNNICPIRCEKKVKESFSPVDIDQLKRHCKKIRDRAILEFLYSTGCRISEVVGLNREDINFASGECIVFGKGKKERTVFLDDVCMVTLREYLLSRTDECEALFVNRHGNRILPDGVRFILKELSRKSGVQNVHPHRFRRTMITHLLNRGMAIQDVAILAGHEKIDTTMKYFHSNKSRIKSAFRMYMD